ncbi:MAG: TolC family protein [Lautropia sp.]|nr:TolC family protein [Lautropia sp.]
MSEVFMNIAGKKAEETNQFGSLMRLLLPVLLTSSWLPLVQAQSQQSLERLQPEQDVKYSQSHQWATDERDPRWKMPPSLKEAIDQALAKRLDVRLSLTDARQARARMRQAQSKFHPRLGVEAEFRNTRQWDNYSDVKATYDIAGTGPVNIEVVNEANRYQFQPKIEASYSLYSGGGDEAGVRHARLLTDAADLGVEAISQQAILDVVRRYLELRKQCMEWESSSEDMRAVLLKADIMRRRHDRGRLSDIELQEAEIERLEKQKALFNRVQQVKAAYGRYSVAVTDQPNSVQEASFACHFDRKVKEEIDKITGLTTESSSLKKAALDEEAAREQIDIEKAAKKPQVSLFAQYNFVSRQDDMLRRLVGNTKRQDAVFGLRVSFTLYDGWLSDAREQEAQVSLQRQQIRREQQVSRLEAFRYRQRLRQEEMSEAVKMAKTKLNLAISRRVLAEKRFKLGKINALQNEEIRANENKARRDLDIAEIDRMRVDVESLYEEAASSTESDSPAS